MGARTISSNPTDLVSACGRYRILSGRLVIDSVRATLPRSAHLLAALVMSARGGIVRYVDAARAIGSAAADPSKLLKVVLHRIRKVAGAAIPITTVRGQGLRWTGADVRRHRTAPVDLSATTHSTPLADRLVALLRAQPGRILPTAEIAEALRLDGPHPERRIKDALHRARMDAAADGIALPIERVRARGLVWGGCSRGEIWGA